MGEHVDVMLNDWTNEKQVLVGRVVFEGGDIFIKEAAPRFVSSLERARAHAAVERTAAQQVERFIKLIDSVALSVTELHDDQDCPFVAGDTLAMSVHKVDGEFVLP